jgi:protein lifeguard
LSYQKTIKKYLDQPQQQLPYPPGQQQQQPYYPQQQVIYAPQAQHSGYPPQQQQVYFAPQQQPTPYNPTTTPSQNMAPYADPEDPGAENFEFTDESIRKAFIRKVFSILSVSIFLPGPFDKIKCAQFNLK